MSRPRLCTNSAARAERTPAAHENTTRLPGSCGILLGSNCESGSDTEPGICPAANSCGSRTSTITIEPSRKPRLIASRLRSMTVGWLIQKTSCAVRECIGGRRQPILEAQKRDALDLLHRRVEL